MINPEWIDFFNQRDSKDPFLYEEVQAFFDALGYQDELPPLFIKKPTLFIKKPKN